MKHDSENTRQAFGSRLNALLDERGLPSRGRPQALRRLTGVSLEGCRKWLRGMAIPTKAKIKILSDHFDCREEWLEYGRGPMSRPGSELEPQDAELLALARQRLFEADGADKETLRTLLAHILK